MGAMNADGKNERLSQIRKIRPTRRSVSGLYVFRGTTQIAYESTLERDFIVLMEHSIKVDDIISQPCRLSFHGENDQIYPYTPDFLVYYRDGSKPMLVEVKPGEEWRKHWRKWSVKWKIARRYAREQGWTFRIYDEGRIRNQTLVNINFLQRYDRTMVSEDHVLPIIESVKHAGRISVGRLLEQSSESVLMMRPLIWHLVAVRRMECDMAEPLGDHTIIWITQYE